MRAHKPDKRLSPKTPPQTHDVAITCSLTGERQTQRYSQTSAMERESVENTNYSQEQRPSLGSIQTAHRGLSRPPVFYSQSIKAACDRLSANHYILSLTNFQMHCAVARITVVSGCSYGLGRFSPDSASVQFSSYQREVEPGPPRSVFMSRWRVFAPFLSNLNLI